MIPIKELEEVLWIITEILAAIYSSIKIADEIRKRRKEEWIVI